MSGTQPDTIASLGAKANDFLYGINNLNRDMIVQVLEDQRPYGGQLEGSFVLVKAGSGTHSEWLTEHEGRVVEAKELIEEILRKKNSGERTLHIFNRNNLKPYISDNGKVTATPLSIDSKGQSTSFGGPGGLRKSISEANLEALIVDNLEILEPGLELIRKQFDCPGVGRLDLLCRDNEGNLVVVELKKFGVKHDSILDQLLRYMGYIKQHVAVEGQIVKGIIVVGKVDEKLKYAVFAVPNVLVKSFDLTIQ